MSRSPRRRLQTAAETLDALLELCERYPDAREEITRAVGGPEQLARVVDARDILRRAGAALGDLTAQDATDTPADTPADTRPRPQHS